MENKLRLEIRIFQNMKKWSKTHEGREILYNPVISSRMTF